MMADESRQNLLSGAAVISADADLESGQTRTPFSQSQGQQQQQQQPLNTNAVRDYFEQSSHPVAALFYILFRLGALLMYLLGSIFTDNFTLVFVVTILLLAFDFWTVKNVSGRLLVGLRWWNEIQEDGTNKWVFESANVTQSTYQLSRFSVVLDSTIRHTDSLDLICSKLYLHFQSDVAGDCSGGDHFEYG
ncbi:hypothetical protein [Absidia glauca]|uniref:Golgi apparatus membrane protein TVP23 n=1 Tax=Absidia glauca TaxID=4829 RepID=A0A163TIB2_ABSGL|nr:hypothetical protein [Absidia glauca]